MFATCADLIKFEIPENAAEDSYSFLPVLLGEEHTKPIREATVYHSFYGDFAICQEPWKLVLTSGSGGWSFPSEKLHQYDSLPEFQLYNMQTDPSEQFNLIAKKPEKADDLKQLLINYINNGRSTPGKPLNNDYIVGKWEQIHWINNKKRSK